MKRKLFNQMCAEWRSNIWMLAELLIVGVVLWVITLVLWTMADLRFTEKGYDTSDVYVGSIRRIYEDSPAYRQYDENHGYKTDLEPIIAKLRSNPYVEEVGMGNNALPYNYNFYGSVIEIPGDTAGLQYMGNRRIMTPEVVKILRLKGTRGETSEQLAAMVEKGEALISPCIDPDSPSPELFLGREVFLNEDSSKILHIGAVVKGIQRSDYEPMWRGMLVMREDPYNNWWQDLIVRVKPGMGRRFIESLKPGDMAHMNTYIPELKSVESIRQSCQLDQTTTIRNYATCGLFLLVAIFLGFLGSFWFRTQQRVPEIAIRKVNGATDGEIFRRLLAEGLLLLAAATPLILAAAIALSRSGIINNKRGMGEWLPYAAMAVAVAFLALIISAGVWLPARKAMKINPAEALKDQ